MKVAVTLSSWRLCFYREYSTYWKPDQIPGSCSVWRSVSLRRRSRGWSLLWVRTCPLQKRWHLHQGTYSFSEINGYIYSMNISLSCRPFHYYYISQRLIGHEIFKLFFFFSEFFRRKRTTMLRWYGCSRRCVEKKATTKDSLHFRNFWTISSIQGIASCGTRKSSVEHSSVLVDWKQHRFVRIALMFAVLSITYRVLVIHSV